MEQNLRAAGRHGLILLGFSALSVSGNSRYKNVAKSRAKAAFGETF